MAARPPALELVRRLRARFGPRTPIIGAGGVHEPEHALDLRRAGADLVQLDSGLVYSGPGLPKRVNEALLDEARTADAATPAPALRPAEASWLWTTFMGAGMLLGSVLALIVAAGRVVLPYDEAFTGLSRAQIASINPRLLDFMAHDRVSVAGTMIAVGVMYVGLSLYGLRRGQHWAQQTVFVSAGTGFLSFFLFLGFGYLDPFHAFVTAVLFQFLLLALHSRLGPAAPGAPPPLREDWTWRWSLWGQLFLILHGFGLLAAGLVISGLGSTTVFVPEDLEFMHTTAQALWNAHPRLVPLVAHDRATLGGMLLSSGWALLLPALWGFRNGSRWLAVSLSLAGLAAYGAVIGVHLAVGYTNLNHLIPAFAGLALYLAGVGLSLPFLWRDSADASPRSRPPDEVSTAMADEAAGMAQVRAAIDETDSRLVDLLSERGRLVRRIQRVRGNVARLPEREAQIHRRVAERNPGPYPNSVLRRLWDALFEAAEQL